MDISSAPAANPVANNGNVHSGSRVLDKTNTIK